MRCSRTSSSTRSASASSRPMASTASPGDRGPHRGVKGGRPGDLADVVQQGGQQQDVGPVDLGQMALRLDHRLYRVPVDGVEVDRVVLRPGPDRHPSRASSGRCSRPGRAPPRPGSDSRRRTTSPAAPRGPRRATVWAGPAHADPGCPPSRGRGPGRAGRPARRPADPTRGSLGLVVRPRATSPWWMIRPCSAWMYSGRRSRLTKLSTRRCGMACRAARAVRSTACPIRRAARLTSRCRSSGSAIAQSAGHLGDLAEQQPVQGPARAQV